MTVLATTDFSDQSRTAVRQAARIAVDGSSDLVLLHAVEAAAKQPSWVHSVNQPDDLESEWRRSALAQLGEFVDDHIPESDRPDSISFRVYLEVAEASIESALEEEDFELVVLGATGQNRIASALLGSTPEAIVRRSETPVLVVPDEGRVGGYDQIVAPVDFTDCSRKSFEKAVSMARSYNAKLTALHAHHYPVTDTAYLPSQLPAETVENFEEQSREQFREFIDSFDLDEVDCEERHVTGPADRAIANTVDEVGADLVVMGTHGRRGFDRLFLGSTATKVLRSMPCSVMTVRYRDEEHREEEN